MTTTIGISELSRNLTTILEKHDYVVIEDKRTRQRKDLFVSNQYTHEAERYLKKIITNDSSHK